MATDAKCEECPYRKVAYPLLHPTITVHLAMSKCKDCGKVIPCYEARTLRKQYNFLGLKFERIVGEVCKDCSSKYPVEKRGS